MDNVFYMLVVSALVSWQMRTIVGLILLDVVFGIAVALKTGVFDFQKLADFYRSKVLPYILGYLVLYVAIHFIIPPDAVAGYGNELTTGAVVLAWGALFATLVNSFIRKFRALYDPTPPPPPDTLTVTGNFEDVELATPAGHHPAGDVQSPSTTLE